MDDKTFQNQHINASNRWIRNFESMIESETLNEKVMQSVIQSFISLKEKFGDIAEKYVMYGLKKSKKVDLFFENKKDSILGEMFDYKHIKENFLTNKKLLQEIQRMNSRNSDMVKNPNKFSKKREFLKNERGESAKPNKVGLFDKIKSDVYISLGEVEPSNSYIKDNSIERLINKKSKQIEYSDFITFSDFAKSFNQSAKESEIQEALSWFAVYIESEDFSHDDIIINGSEIDFKKTILNISNKINERALSPYAPFIYNKESETLIYNPAPSNTVDVMLFIEKSQKIVGASATRDRTTKIEGNQFIRHNFKLKAIGVLLEKEINSNQSIKNKGDLKASQVSEIINEKNFLIKLNTKGFMNKIKDKLAPEVYENFTNRRKSEFTNHLSIIRESVLEKTKVDLHSMGLNINKKELLMVDKASRFDGDYFFFGEVTQKSKFPELMAGLNKFAYKENFNDVSSFKMDGESINHFLNNLKFKYNNVEKLDKIDNYAHRFLYHILDRSQSEMNIGDCFSEGFAFKEERELVFKSISTIINQVNNLENLSHSNVFTMLKENLTTLNNEELNNLTVSMTSAGVGEMIINKISKINKAQSEVSGEYREIENSLKSLELKIENYSNQKIINDLEEFGGIEEVVRQLELLKQLKSPIDSSKSRIKPKF